MEAPSFCGLCDREAEPEERCLQGASLYPRDCLPMGKEVHGHRKCGSFSSLIWALWSGQKEAQLPLGTRIFGFGGNQMPFILHVLLEQDQSKAPDIQTGKPGESGRGLRHLVIFLDLSP